MIKNPKQASVAKANLKKMLQDKQAIISKKESMADLTFELAINSIDSLIEDLSEEINNYEQLISQGFHCFKNKSLDNLGEIFISCRLAQGISQKELAISLGIQEQQIQRYEQTDYEGASLTRLQEIRQALNIPLTFCDIHILGKQPHFLLPANIIAADVEAAESKIRENHSLVF